MTRDQGYPWTMDPLFPVTSVMLIVEVVAFLVATGVVRVTMQSPHFRVPGLHPRHHLDRPRAPDD